MNCMHLHQLCVPWTVLVAGTKNKESTLSRSKMLTKFILRPAQNVRCVNGPDNSATHHKQKCVTLPSPETPFSSAAFCDTAATAECDAWSTAWSWEPWPDCMWLPATSQPWGLKVHHITKYLYVGFLWNNAAKLARSPPCHQWLIYAVFSKNETL